MGTTPQHQYRMWIDHGMACNITSHLRQHPAIDKGGLRHRIVGACLSPADREIRGTVIRHPERWGRILWPHRAIAPASTKVRRRGTNILAQCAQSLRIFATIGMTITKEHKLRKEWDG